MRVLCVALAVLVGCKKSVGFDLPKDPTAAADAVFERYLEASGGLEASRAIQNLRIEAQSTLPAQGISMRMLILEERPDRSRIEMDMPMLGAMHSGYADGIAWETSPLTGPRIKEGAEAEEARRSGRLDLYEDFRTHWPERALAGEVDFASVLCFEVQTTTALGKVETLYFAVESGRWMGSKSVVSMDMGDVPMTNEVLEYEEVDGVLIPTVTRQLMGPAEMITRFESMQVNLPEFPDLTPPPEILALVDGAPDAP